MKMKSYSIDLREKIVNAYERGGTSVRKVAVQFGVAKSYVQKLLQLKKTQGHLEPKKPGGTMRGKLDDYGRELSEMVKSYPDATRIRILRVFWRTISSLGMCKCHVWCITKTRTNTKKKTLRSSQGQTERVQKLRIEYWEKVKNIDPEDLVFIDEMGVLLGLTRTHARSKRGTRVYDFKPYYRGAKVSVIGAIGSPEFMV
jgi:transposase-like protein